MARGYPVMVGKPQGIFKCALSDLQDLIDSKSSQAPSCLPRKPLLNISLSLGGSRNRKTNGQETA